MEDEREKEAEDLVEKFEEMNEEEKRKYWLYTWGR